MDSEESVKRGLDKKVVIIVVVIALVVFAVIVGLASIFNNHDSMGTSEKNESLSNQLNDEQATIENVFNQRFSFLRERYEIEKVVLLNQGEYAAIILRLDEVEYRAIMYKENGEWFVSGVPAIVLYYGDFPDIPEEVVRKVNELGAEVEDE